MIKHPPEIPASFYRRAGGAKPILDWLRSLPQEDRRAIGADLATVQSSRRIARLVFFVDDGRIGVVHGFIKKTQKMPAEDLENARKRMKEMKA